MAELRMRFLGGIELTLDGVPIAELRMKKTQALLCYLAVTGVTHDRLALASLLWSDLPEPKARSNLRKVIASLKQPLEPFLAITSESLALDTNKKQWLDVKMLEDAAVLLRSSGINNETDLGRIQAAVELYRGDFLAGFYVGNAPLFEEWAQVQQVRLRELGLDLMNSLALLYAERGDLQQAVNAMRQLLHLEPWREEAQRQLMLYLASSGRRGEALAQYETCRQALLEEFGVEPNMETTKLLTSIRDGPFESPFKPHSQKERSILEERGRPPPSPYRGLFAFRREDSEFFFGRESFSKRLVSEASRQSLLAIVGPSGCGKSSVAAAGLLAAAAADQNTTPISLRPGSQPQQALSLSLLPLLEPEMSETEYLIEAKVMASALEDGRLSLGRIIDRILESEGMTGRLLILIDQFEELFTLCPHEDQRLAFLDTLLETTAEQRRRRQPLACICLTLRADFMEQALSHRSFADALQSSTMILGPMTPEEMKRAIVKPARVLGVEFEAGLAERILDDVGTRPGNLPLLEFALSKLWEEQDGWLLTHEAYEAIGRVDGGLVNHADDVYARLADPERMAARRIFSQLVKPGDKGEDTRRLATRQEIGDGDWPVVQKLADGRLLVTGRNPVGMETAELAHEALISAWSRLGKWLEEDRVFRLWQERLRTTMATWLVSDKDEGALLRGRPLAEAEGWLDERGDQLGHQERAFIVESRALRIQRERQHEAELRSRESARRRIIAGLSVSLMLVAVAMVFALVQNSQAAAQARLAFARELTLAAVANLDSDPELSTHLALQAIHTTYEEDGTILNEAEEALHQAVQASRVVFTIPRSGGVAFSPDGLRLASGSEDGSVMISDALTGKAIHTFSEFPGRVTGLSYSPDGRLLAIIGQGLRVMVRDIETGQVILDIPGTGQAGTAPEPGAIEFSPGGEYLLLASLTADTQLWEIASQRKILQIKDSSAPDATFSPDGARVALTTATWDVSRILEQRPGGSVEGGVGTLILDWPDRQFDFTQVLVGIQTPSSNTSALLQSGSVAFSPDGKLLLASVVSNQAVIMDATTGELRKILAGHGGIIHSMAFSPDGSRIATASADGTARLWDGTTGESLLTLDGHQNEVIELAFSPSGQYLVTSSLDGTTRVWDISPRKRGERLTYGESDEIVSLTFADQGDRLVGATADGRVLSIDSGTGAIASDIDLQAGQLTSLAMDPGERQLAIGTNGGQVIILDTNSGDVRQRLEVPETNATLAFSPDGGLLAGGNSGGVLTLWSTARGDVIGQWQVHEGFINGLVFNEGGDRLVTAGFDSQGYILDTNLLLSEGANGQGQEIPGIPEEIIVASLSGHRDLYIKANTSPDGQSLVTAGFNGTAAVWDATTGQVRLVIEGHAGEVRDAIFTTDGRQIATGGSDGNIILWDATTGEQRLVLASLDEPVNSLAFSPDGRYLAAGGADGSLRVYLLKIDDLVALAERRLTREMSNEECQRYLHVAECPG